MRIKTLLLVILALTIYPLYAQETTDHYIEVIGTSEIEIVPDKIHYIIEIREYFEEEFDGKSKPEEYHTKVPLSQIEQGLRKNLAEAGITYTRDWRLLAKAGTRLLSFQAIRHHTDRFQTDR